MSARSVPTCCVFGPERPVRLPVFVGAPGHAHEGTGVGPGSRVYSRVLPILEAARNDVLRVPDSRVRFLQAAKLNHVLTVRDLTSDADARGMLLAYEVFRAFLRDHSVTARPAKRARVTA